MACTLANCICRKDLLPDLHTVRVADVDLVIEPAKFRAVEQAKKSKGGVDLLGRFMSP